MAVKDIRSNIQPRLAMDAAISTNTTTNGSSIDTKDFEMGLMFAVFAQDWTDGAYEIQIQEADDTAFTENVATVSGDKLIGSIDDLGAALAAGAIIATLGVISNLRFVRLNIISTGTSTGAQIVGIVMQMGENLPVV